MTNLIMLPYAGSLGYAYRQWQTLADDEIHIHMVDYDGRGQRFQKQRARSWNELVNQTFEQIKEIILRNDDYILFGHSMGAKVVHDLYYEIEEAGLPLPRYLIFSGCQTPDSVQICFKDLSDEAFLLRFIQMGGITPTILENEELRKIVLDCLREDTTLLDDYRYAERCRKIRCPVIVFNGSRDVSSREVQWNQFLGARCLYIILEGDHFFLFPQKERLFRIIKQKISS